MPLDKKKITSLPKIHDAYVKWSSCRQFFFLHQTLTFSLHWPELAESQRCDYSWNVCDHFLTIKMWLLLKCHWTFPDHKEVITLEMSLNISWPERCDYSWDFHSVNNSATTTVWEGVITLDISVTISLPARKMWYYSRDVWDPFPVKKMWLLLRFPYLSQQKCWPQ